MALLTFSFMARDELARFRRLFPRSLALLIEGMNAGAGNMRECEIRILRDRALERLRRARPGRQHRVDAVAIGGGGRRGSGREGKPVAVFVRCAAHGSMSRPRPAPLDRVGGIVEAGGGGMAAQDQPVD